MGSVLAERLSLEGLTVTLATPADVVSSWSGNTGERARVQGRLLDLGVELITAHELQDVRSGDVTLACSYSGRARSVEADSVVLVGQRSANDVLYQELRKQVEMGAQGIPLSLKRIGDCDAPAIIAAAVYAGHRYAQDLDTDAEREQPVKYDRVQFE